MKNEEKKCKLYKKQIEFLWLVLNSIPMAGIEFNSYGWY